MIKSMERNKPNPETAEQQITEEKKRLRRELLRLRDRELAPDYRKRCSAEIINRLWELPEFYAAREIFLYASYRGEVETLPLLARLLERTGDGAKRVALPRVLDRCGRMEFYWIAKPEDLTSGCCGILEPAAYCTAAEPADCNAFFAVIPAVAADMCGNRMGYGGGYYDRYLARVRNSACANFKTAALVYEEQLVAALPAEETDFQPDYIITQNRTIKCGGRKDE